MANWRGPKRSDYGGADLRLRGMDARLWLRCGWAFVWMHEPDAAVRQYETALSLNPNFWDWTFPNALVYAGAPARALDLLQAHVRLDPFHPPMVHATQGHALYTLKRYAEAVGPLRESIRRGPHVLLGHLWLAATLVRIGQPAEARDLDRGGLETSTTDDPSAVARTLALP